LNSEPQIVRDCSLLYHSQLRVKSGYSPLYSIIKYNSLWVLSEDFKQSLFQFISSYLPCHFHAKCYITLQFTLFLRALQSMMYFGLFYNCSPLVLIQWLLSPISNAHYLQIFNWIQPPASRSAYPLSTLWFM
jgi:hypothetical protein